MPTETDPWERNAKLTGADIANLREAAAGTDLVLVRSSAWIADKSLAGWTPEIRQMEWHDPDAARFLVDYEWAFQGFDGQILKTPNHLAVDAQGRAITVDPDAAPGLPSVDLPEHDDGWSDVAREVGVHEGTLRAKARRALRDHGDGATVSLGSDRGQWEFEAKTARMLKGPSDGLLLQPEWVEPPAPEVEQQGTNEVEQARAAIVRRIIAAGDDEVDEIETLAKAYDLLR